MGYNVLSGSISNIYDIRASGSFTGSFGGDGTNLENVTQFDLFGDTAAGRIPFFKEVSGEKHLEGDATFFFNSVTDTLTISRLTASSGLNFSGLSAGTATTSSFIAIDSNNNLILTSSTGKISELNNAVANRLITFGANTTELDGEANLTFDGNFLSLQGGLVLKRRQITSNITASSTDYYIGISASANLDVRLPGAQTLTNGQTFVIKDEGGNANIHQITVSTSGSQTIDGSPNVRLESPFAAINVYSDGTSKYFIF